MEATDRVVLELYRSARELPIPEFQARAIALCKTLLRFDSSMWGVGKWRPAKGLAIQSIHLHNQPEELLPAYEEIKDRDRAAIETARHFGQVCNFHFPDLFCGPRDAPVVAHNRRFEIQNLLVTTVGDPSLSSVGFLSLWRAKERDRYSEDEARRGEVLMPHLLEAGTINRLLWLNQVNGSVLAKRGARAVADLHGRLAACDGAFVELLEKEWPDWLPPVLPPRLTESLRCVPGGRFVGMRIVVTAAVVREMLFVTVRDTSAIEVLSPAERSVASLVGSGLSYKEAARRLGVSPATVRNELHSVYMKLGIANKAALAKSLSEVGA